MRKQLLLVFGGAAGVAMFGMAERADAAPMLGGRAVASENLAVTSIYCERVYVCSSFGSPGRRCHYENRCRGRR